ncbi:branched-chain amino acid aminotransferase [Neobacillus bataviensis]|uniref:branched-chain amino acid aminotransferase n=1 Tax=Neobacillus bataviensis TaxID=220685 RepID=UPI001CBDE00B|nr:branched-chain amino acid aminotransferase [Neobacillus bataviensis]
MLKEKDPKTLFSNAYIERCSKDTETMIAEESSAFLNEPIVYLKIHKNEFVYMELSSFEEIKVEAVSLEVDDVFRTYDVMLGLKLQKKYEKYIKEYLNSNLIGEGSKFDLMFSPEDGLWNLNFTLNYVAGFQEEMTISEAFQLIYSFLSKLVAEVNSPA